MKYRLLRFSLLCMLVMLCGGSMWAGSVTTWVKTDPTALTTNDVVVIVDQTSGKAMEANGTSAPKATDVTLKSDKSEISSGVIAAMQFKVTIGTTKIDNVDTRSYQFANGDNYLYCTNTNNGVKVGTNDANVFIIKKADANSEEDFIFNTTQSRYLGVYNNQDWRCYTTVNNNIKGTVTAFYKKVVVESADAPDAPTFSPVAGTYYTGQYVEISCTTEGATIKKSLDGENFETYSEALPVTSTTTVYAYAELNGEKSETVSAKYVIGSTYDSFAPMQEAAAAEGFSNKAIQYRATGGMVVAYVNGKNAYLIDGSGNGILAYNKDGLGELAAGQKMNYDDGYLTATLENYQGNAELTGIVFPEMTGGTVTVTPVEKTLPLTSANQSTLVTLKGLTYNSSDQTFGDGTNTIKFYDKFKTNVVLENGKAYDVTGIVVLYNDVIEISPRTANDISEIITTAGALNAAAIAAGEEEKAVTFNFTNVKVVYAKYGYYYLADNDNSGYALLKGSQYGTEADMTTGSLITGTFTGTVSAKNGTPQASANSFSLTSKTADPNPRTPTTITIDQLGNNVNNYIKIENAELVQRLGNDITFKVGETTFKAYNSFALNVTLEEGKAYDIIGFGNYHAAPGNPIYYQILPTEITEVSTTPDPFYILGVNDANENDVWDIPDEFVEMTWDTENEAYTYELNNTTNAFFCFSTNNEVSDWDTFNSTYRWALGTGGNYTFDLDNLGTALELSQGDKTIVLPAGEWTISVTADKKLTITGEATPITPTGAKYYVVGNMTNWDVDEEAYEMTRNEGADIDEYSFTMDLTTESQFKVVKVEEGKENVWYPEGMGNNYGENGEITADGTYTIYFRPNYDGGDDWFYNCIYVAVEEVPEPFVFRDIKLDLTVQGFLTDDEWASNEDITAKLLIAEGGEISRDDDAATPNATLTGHPYQGGTSHGWKPFTMVAPVTGKVKISIGGCNFNGSYNVLTVTPKVGEAFTIEAPATCYAANNENSIGIGYYDFGDDIVNVTFTGPQYTPYIAVEAVDEIPVQPSSYNVTFAAEGAEGVVPAAVEVEAGGKVTIPANYTLYKEGYTLTGWNDGTNDYAAGAEITPEADMTLYAVFTENTVNLADRTETVSISWALGQKSGNEGVEYNGNNGVVVTRAAVNNKRIDAKLDVDATNGKFYNKRDDELAMINANTKLTVPACKGAIVTVKAYATGYNLTIDGTAMTDNGDKTYTYTVADEKESIDIIPAAQVYLSFVNVTLPVVDGSNLLYTWESPIGNPVETGGTIAYVNGDGNRLNYQNSGYYTICLNGKKANINDATASANAGKMVITLDNALHAGDKINMTAYITNSASKTASAYVLFETGTSIDGEDYSDAANIGLATPGSPTTTTITVPEAAAGSKTITLTRSKTGTNLFITKLVITTTVEDDPDAIATPVITPKTGTYASEQEVTITCETEDANIYYTLDGTDPTAESTEYTAAFTVTETTTVRAIAIKGENSSEIAESVITIVNVQPGESDLIWDYTEKNIPTKGPDNGLYYNAYVNDAAGTNNGMHGVKLNSTSYAYFAKNPVEGKLTLTFGLRSGAGEYAVNVYSCGADGTRGDLIGEVSVSESPGTGSIVIPSTVPGVRIERKTPSEGVLSKIVFKEIIPRTFVDFEITNEQLKGTVADMDLPEGVILTGTQPAANNNAHGYISATIVVPTDGGAVKFTIGGCQYNNGTFTVKNSNNETVATLSSKTTSCYHQDGSVVTYFYTGEATTLTFSTIENLPYFKAEAVDVEEVTVTYKDQNGEVLGTKKVIEGSAIGEAPYTETDLTIPEGYAFRGWIYASGVKVKNTDIVDGNKTVMASVTAIEDAPTAGSIQVYDLTQTTFYPEDHENFDVNGGKYNDGQHGWDIASGGSFSVKVAGKAQVVLSLCEYGSGTTITVTNGEETVAENVPAKAASGKDGATTTVNYNGEATTLTFTFATQTYLHKVTVYNVKNFIEKDEATGYYMVPAGDAVALVLAINSASAEANSKIFLPNSTYDLGELVKTPISGTNVSIIGESMDGVIIKTTPDVSIEGLDKADMFKNSGTGLYLQDLTLQNAMEYTGNTGRAAVLQDKGTQTIYKNVKMLSHQDTYYTNNSDGEYYFEDCEIHGTVDYVCGTGDVFFNKTLFYNEYRSSGDCIAAPNQKKQFGYIFNDCTIDGDNGQDGKYRLARPWAAGAQAIFINTTMNIKPVAAGWDDWSPANAVSRFAEYKSVDANGDVIDLSSRKNSFNGVANNPVLSEEEAANYTLDKVFTSWAPNEIAAQVEAPAAKLDGNTISWTAVEGATAYAVYDGETLLGITTGTTWITDDAVGAPRRAESIDTNYSIRAANGRGGFGKAKIVSEADGITNINAELNGDLKIYDLQGRQVKTATKGVYIINGKKVVIK